MSETNIFRCKDQMPASGDGVVRATSDPDENARYGGQKLPGFRKNPNDVVNVRVKAPATGRRP